MGEEAGKNDESLVYGVEHIQKKIELFMDEEVEVSHYLDEITNTYSEMGRINEMIEHLNSNFEAFNGYTTQIEGTCQQLEGITGISANTNLLALNALIEAARAGEAGRYKKNYLVICAYIV